MSDAILYRYKDTYYSNNLYDEILKRYTKYFDKVSVVCRVKDIDSLPNLRVSSCKDVEFIPLPSISYISLSLPKRVQRVKEVLKELIERYEYIILRLPSHFGLIAGFVAQRVNRNYVVEVTGSARDVTRYYGNIIAYIYSPIYEYLTKRVIYKAKGAVYVSVYLFENYPVHKGVVTEIISNVDIEYNSTLKPKSIGSTVSLGSLLNYNIYYKNCKYLIDMLDILKGYKEYSFRLYIHGFGDSSECKEYAKELGVSSMVSFGKVLKAGDEVVKFLDSIDIYLQPSKTEGLSRATIEALGRAKVVVATDVGGTSEIIRADMMVSHTDAAQMAQTIINTVSSKTLQTELAQRNLSIALKFDKRVLQTKRENFFNKVFI